MDYHMPDGPSTPSLETSSGDAEFWLLTNRHTCDGMSGQLRILTKQLIQDDDKVDRPSHLDRQACFRGPIYFYILNFKFHVTDYKENILYSQMIMGAEKNDTKIKTTTKSGDNQYKNIYE